jgi:sulfur carrier protein ThiS
MGVPRLCSVSLDPQMFVLKNDDFTWKEGLTVRDLLEELKGRGKYRAAVESTGTLVVSSNNIVTRDQHSSRVLGKNDMVCLMSFVTGG